MERGHDEDAGLDIDPTWPGTAAGLLAEMTELSAEQAPRRFSLCGIDVDADDGAVLAWGFAFAQRAILCTPEGTPKGVFPSAESVVRRFGRGEKLRLIWIDPPDAVAPGETATP